MLCERGSSEATPPLDHAVGTNITACCTPYRAVSARGRLSSTLPVMSEDEFTIPANAPGKVCRLEEFRCQPVLGFVPLPEAGLGVGPDNFSPREIGDGRDESLREGSPARGACRGKGASPGVTGGRFQLRAASKRKNETRQNRSRISDLLT